MGAAHVSSPSHEIVAWSKGVGRAIRVPCTPALQMAGLPLASQVCSSPVAACNHSFPFLPVRFREPADQLEGYFHLSRDEA